MTDLNNENPPWYSSYEKNNYGDLFYALMRIYKPKKVVELGTKAGYSAYHIARGLKDNRRGTLDCYDLWERYEFKSVPKSVAEKNLKKFKDIIKLKQRDAIGVNKLYKKIDILHVDVSNEGGILEKIIPN
ncbi:MAG: class I SAM-dependent methyltransferase [Parcubacteria group bacterium]|nr:class I SAM-dependent methyltransferase [Parcubacteria group bacterium]